MADKWTQTKESKGAIDEMGNEFCISLYCTAFSLGTNRHTRRRKTGAKQRMRVGLEQGCGASEN